MHLHDVETVLARRGWRLERITGSHRHYRNAYGQLLTIVAHGRRTFSQTELKILRGDLARLAEERRQQETKPAAGSLSGSRQERCLGQSPTPAPVRIRNALAPRRERTAVPIDTSPASTRAPHLALPFPAIIFGWLSLGAKRYDRHQLAHCKMCGRPGATWRYEMYLTQAEYDECPDDGPEMGEWVRRRAERYPIALAGSLPYVARHAVVCATCAVALVDHAGCQQDTTRETTAALAAIGIGPQHPLMAAVMERGRTHTEQLDARFYGGEINARDVSVADVWYPNGSTSVLLKTSRREHVPRLLAQTYEAQYEIGTASHQWRYLDNAYRDPVTGDIPAPQTHELPDEGRAECQRERDAVARAAWYLHMMGQFPNVERFDAQTVLDAIAERVQLDMGESEARK